MGIKPENQFISGIHKYLPTARELHREKMNNPYRGGTADWWYSGRLNDMWIEYKFLPRIPQRGVISPERVGLTALQLDWLSGRYKEGRNVRVIVGCPSGGVVMSDLEWERDLAVSVYCSRLVDRKALAQYITHQTLG